jgi:hypothetical protein
MRTDAIAVDLNDCNSMSCGGFFGFFMRWDVCRQPERRKMSVFSTAPLSGVVYLVGFVSLMLCEGF